MCLAGCPTDQFNGGQMCLPLPKGILASLPVMAVYLRCIPPLSGSGGSSMPNARRTDSAGTAGAVSFKFLYLPLVDDDAARAAKLSRSADA